MAAEPEYILIHRNFMINRRKFGFDYIGAAVLIGAGFGSLSGLCRGLTDTQGQAKKIRLTQLLNYIRKHGAAFGRSLGVMAIMYNEFADFFRSLRGRRDDGYNILAAATSTGLFYKSTGGLRKCGIGGAIGIGLALGYIDVASAWFG